MIGLKGNSVYSVHHSTKDEEIPYPAPLRRKPTEKVQSIRGAGSLGGKKSAIARSRLITLANLLPFDYGWLRFVDGGVHVTCQDLRRGAVTVVHQVRGDDLVQLLLPPFAVEHRAGHHPVCPLPQFADLGLNIEHKGPMEEGRCCGETR